MNGTSQLASVRRFVVAADVVDQTLAALQLAGQRQQEAFVLWGGRLSADSATCWFRSCHMPDQTAHSTRDGLLVTVPGHALHAANLAFFQREELMAAQVHTHPTEAYHSATDDNFPLVTLAGAISVVVPDFAAGGRQDLHRWAWYRLLGPRSWEQLDPQSAVSLEEA